MCLNHLSLLVHCDWSVNPAKRWMTWALKVKDGRWQVHAPTLVGDPKTLLTRIKVVTGQDNCALVGFDFPIGLPIEYAQTVGVNNFLETLPRFGKGEWSHFFDVAETPQQIQPHRPFYPARPGGASTTHLVSALQVRDLNALRRRCEHATSSRRPASPLFWTLGAQQVGKAAISGWRSVLIPALADPALRLSIWPFSGAWETISVPGSLVIAETYPGEIYTHLELFPGTRNKPLRTEKRNTDSRAQKTKPLLEWAIQRDVLIVSELESQIASGFGPLSSGEDAFDAVIGLFGLLNVAIGDRASGEPDLNEIRRIEGWIFGQQG
jgi:hypothetical protein